MVITKSAGMTLPYKIILRKLWIESHMGRIKISDARKILTCFFRMGKYNWRDILTEMKGFGYIEFRGTRYGIQIIEIPEGIE